MSALAKQKSKPLWLAKYFRLKQLNKILIKTSKITLLRLKLANQGITEIWINTASSNTTLLKCLNFIHVHIYISFGAVSIERY